MAIKFMDGFDPYQNQSSITTALSRAGYTATGATSVVVGRTNAQRCLQLGDGSTASSLSKTWSSSQNLVVFGFAYKAVERSDIVTIENVGTLTWSSVDGTLSIAGGTGTAAVILNTWYYLEVAVDKVNSQVRLYVNNELDMTTSLPSTATFLTSYVVTWASGAGGTKYLDDLIVIDSSTGTYVDRVGPIQITQRLPDTDYVQGWTPSSGTNHWDLVDNQPPLDTSYLQSNTSGVTDKFTSATAVPDADVIAIGMTVLNKKTDIDGRQLGMIMGSTTTKEVIDTDLSTSLKYSMAIFETQPDGSAWSQASALSTPFGIVVRP